MATKTVRGIVRSGRIEPVESLDVAEGTEVFINVPVAPPSTPNRPSLTFGMFAKPDGRMSTWDDFQDAKKIWESK